MLQEVQEYISGAYAALITEGGEDSKEQLMRYITKYLQDRRIAVAGMTQAELVDAINEHGFTGLQRFFLSYASIWRTKNRDELAEQYLQIDPHSPAECRTNGIARNVDLFHKAFGVQPGDGMWLAPEQRVRIW